jgi:PTH1 family peptidyl-tRNA hydrolase
MKFLIVGLGNPGAEYAETRHNIGFKVLEFLAKELGGSFSIGRLADRTEVKFKGKTLILIKPTTYMNLSGKAVNYWMQAEKINRDQLLVITDDIALPFGKLRMKPVWLRQGFSSAWYACAKYTAICLVSAKTNRPIEIQDFPPSA